MHVIQTKDGKYISVKRSPHDAFAHIEAIDDVNDTYVCKFASQEVANAFLAHLVTAYYFNDSALHVRGFVNFPMCRVVWVD